MTFFILQSKMNELEGKINKLKNKLQNDLVFNVVKEIEIQNKNLTDIIYKCYEVEIEGTFQVGDWTFVATLEHTPNGNIVRKVNEELELPEKFKNCGSYCEHCNTSRKRNDTYVVYNNETKEFKQVGKSCLLEYTGIDATRIANYFSLYRECEDSTISPDRVCSLLEQDFIDFCKYEPKYLSSNTIKRRALGLIKEKGYFKEQTWKTVCILREQVNSVSDEEIEELDKWVEALEETNDYFHNSKVAYLQRYYETRDIPLVVSLVGVYLRDKNKAEGVNNVFVGEVGQSVTINVKSSRVLYTKQGFTSYYSDNMYTSYVNELMDEEGHIFIWSTQEKVSNYLDGTTTVEVDGKIYKSVGCTIVAKVIEHNNYKGICQTKVSRGKITPILEEVK